MISHAALILKGQGHHLIFYLWAKQLEILIEIFKGHQGQGIYSFMYYYYIMM